MLRKWLLLGLFCLLAPLRIRAAATDNVTLCWGSGTSGQLGNGQENINSSLPVEVLGNHTFVEVCAGQQHSCALAPSGYAWCWGKNDDGQLGTIRTTSSAVPVKVAGITTFGSITCGGSHSCSLDGQGQAWCWGRNDAGQLGTGSNVSSRFPAKVASGRTFVALSAGRSSTCGLEETGKVFCWGINYDGELGAGLATASSLAPVEVAGGHTFQSISVGHKIACGLDRGGYAWCWGRGYYDFANINASKKRPPQQLPHSPVVAVAAGSSYYCVIMDGGSMRCASAGSGGGKGPGHMEIKVALSTGDQSACVMDASGKMLCFGRTESWWSDGGILDAEVAVQVASNRTFLSLGQSGGSHTCAIATRQARLASSSVRVGAIAGGLAAAVVVLAALAFFALRPGKGWLRRKPPPATLEDGSDSKESPASAAQHSQEDGSSHPEISGALPNTVPAALGMLPAMPVAAAVAGSSTALDTLLPSSSSQQGQATSLDTFLPSSRAAGDSAAAGIDTLLPLTRAVGAPIVNSALQAPTAPAEAPPSHIPEQPAPSHSPSMSEPPSPQQLPPSYLSSVGTGWSGGAAQQPAAVVPAAVLAADMTSSPSGSIHAPGSDPMLSFISSYLDSQPHFAAQRSSDTSQPGAALASGGNASSDGTADTRGSGPLDLWEVQWPELTILRLVGHGSFGAVYLAEWKQIQVAVKVLVAKENMHRGQLELPDKVVQQLQAEAAVMSRMRHPNILQFMGLVTVPPALITEYCSRGSLYDCLAAAGQQPAAAAQLTWRRRLGMAVDAGAGLLYLHGRGIIHRDVKSPNLLVDDAWRVKVADFNLSKLLEGARPNSSLATTAANNPIWQAPEVLEGDKATAASDVYSFAMVLYELLTWRLPWTFDNMTPFKVATTIVAGGRPEVPPRQALPGPDTAAWAGLDAYVQLMRDCWAQQPADRPSFDEVVGRLRRLLADTAGFHLDRRARRPPWR